jgi:restriction endonuclease S subunit
MRDVKLGEIANLINGSTPLKSEKRYWEPEEIPWFTIDDLRIQGKYILSTQKFISKKALDECSLSLAPINSILLCCTASIGAVAINKLELTTNQQFNAITSKDNQQLNIEFLFYWLLNNMDEIKSMGRATTIDYVSMSKLKNIDIKLPSVKTQIQIVEKLDKAFSEIDSLEKNLQLKEEKTNQLSQSMLSAAFTNTEEFEMKTVQLEEACDFFGDGDWIESKDQSESGIRLIQTGNVGIGEFKDRIEKARWISEETFRSLRCTEIIEGDVLVSRLPDPVGRACLIPYLSHKAITAVDCAIIRFNPSRIIPKFFIYYSQSNEYYSTIRPLISGSTRERVSREKLGNLLIPQPTILEQKVIIQKLDKVFVEIEKLKNQISIENERISSLRESILSNAFNFEDKAA